LVVVALLAHSHILMEVLRRVLIRYLVPLLLRVAVAAVYTTVKQVQMAALAAVVVYEKVRLDQMLLVDQAMFRL
jgi:hypothetical protein